MAEKNPATEVAVSIATDLIKSSAKVAWKKVSKYFKALDKKEEIDYGIAYESYLSNTKEKYSKVKTLIYRYEPKSLYSFYECVGVEYGGKTVATSEVTNLFNISSRIIITGTGGIGKTMMLKHFFLNALAITDNIPVILELRSLNSSKDKYPSLRDAIANVLKNNGFEMEDEYFEYSLKEGGYIFLLDGFDEISRDKTQALAEGIKEFSGKYPKNKYILTSRPSDMFIGWNDFCEMTACSLSKEEALDLIKKIEYDETIKREFYFQLKNHLFDKYKSFASNPLLLNILLLTFDINGRIPNQLNDFYEQAFSTLYNRHDATKGYVRDIRTGLGCEDFKTVFSYICFKSYFNDEYEFSESEICDLIEKARYKFSYLRFTVADYLYDLTTSVCMLVREGINYRFTHRSFQEYFAAWYTCKITDDVQTQLITTWMRVSDKALSDSYFPMLFSMQADKVNALIFAPALKDIRKEWRKYHGFSAEFVERMFNDKITVYYGNCESDTVDEKRFAVKLRIKNRLMHNVLEMVCKFNNASSIIRTDDGEHKLGSELWWLSHDDNDDNGDIDAFPCSEYSLKKAIENLGESTVLEGLSKYRDRIQLALHILDSVERSYKFHNVRKVKSIIEQI